MQCRQRSHRYFRVFLDTSDKHARDPQQLAMTGMQPRHFADALGPGVGLAWRHGFVRIADWTGPFWRFSALETPGILGLRAGYFGLHLRKSWTWHFKSLILNL